MEKTEKKQFSLTLLMRVLLGVLVVVSIGIFAKSVMRYNQMREEEEELRTILTAINEKIEELNEMLDSGEEIGELLTKYHEYHDLLQANPELNETMGEIALLKEELEQLLQDSENREYITKVAKEQLNLFPPEVEIYLNDITKKD